MQQLRPQLRPFEATHVGLDAGRVTGASYWSSVPSFPVSKGKTVRLLLPRVIAKSKYNDAYKIVSTLFGAL